jgi:hypothetical protein
MPGDVEVHVSDRAIITALNTPGGAVSNWRNEIGREIIANATVMSPINDVLNAQHRGGEVGEFSRSWGSDNVGSNGHRVRVTVYNGAPHAVYVEEGRSASYKRQRFSWVGWGGDIREVPSTRGRFGKHVLRRALIAAMGSQGLGGM